ncbi:hypothetical protein [Pseudomonas sp. K2I15]|uniref:hypothetical protein n=1 Tax=unclassified Pseudomonas TaxID=196821 RepID=UPI00113193D6|nr:hypothetical protein [Pseudomonas sp. K2I15]
MISASRVNSQPQTPVNSDPMMASASQPLVSVQSVPQGILPASDNPRTQGDRELAPLVGKALLQIKGDPRTDEALMVHNIPPNSTFGQWWSQLGRSMQSQPVVDWMRSVGINPDTVNIAPNSGRIAYQLFPYAPVTPGEADPLDDQGWSQVAGPVQEAARVVGGGSGNTFKPPLSENSSSAPLWLVNHFYREQEHILPAHAHERAADLARDTAFPELDKPRYAGLHLIRSEDELNRQKTVLGNIHNQYSLAGELKYLAAQQTETGYWSGRIPEYLKKTSIGIHADSASAKEQSPGDVTTLSLEAFIQENGWDIPTTSEQVSNLSNALMRPELNAPVLGNYGGALAWPEPLDQTSQLQLRGDLRHGKFGDIDVSSFRNVLEYLMQGTTFSQSALRHPQRVLETLVNSPKGQALGRAIQAKFEARSVKGSVNDWLLAALSVDQDASVARISWGGTAPPSHACAKGPSAVAGVDMAQTSHWGKPPSYAVQNLINELQATGKASSPEKAALQAHVLLSSRAPEFLVKEIPPGVLYGTHSWVSFTTAVARLEEQAPGSTASMTYSDVMSHADIAPISANERQIEYAAQQKALKVWGRVNGIVPSLDVSEAQMMQVRAAFDAQINELKEACGAQSAQMPVRNEMALAHLQKVLPDMDATSLQEKCITLDPPHSLFPGPYSVLDLYMDRNLFDRPQIETPVRFRGNTRGHATNNKWVSSSNAVDINDVLAKTKNLPDISNEFQQAFKTYSNTIERGVKAQVKSMITKLPLEDRKDLEYGKITIAREIKETPINKKNANRDRVNEGVVLVKTERGPRVHTYEINLKNGKISKRPNLGELKSDPKFNTVEGVHLRGSRREFEEIVPSGDYTPGVSDEKTDPLHDVPLSFTSERTSYIVDAVVKDIDMPSINKAAAGLTTFDTEVPFSKKAKEFFLNLIPLRSAIKNFQAGKIAEGFGDLALDVFGFVVGLGAAVKGAKVLAAGASAFAKAARAVKIIGRAALGSLNPLSGAEDIARGVLKLGGKALNWGGNGINQLRGALRRGDLPSLLKKPGIAEGTLKAANAGDEIRQIAKLDDTTGQWHTLDLKTKQPYGKPLENFQPKALSSDELKDNITSLYRTIDEKAELDICYATALRTAQADKKITDRTFKTVIAQVFNGGTPRYNELMKITPQTLKDTFNASDITESGIVTFVSKNGYNEGKITHAAYIQKTSNGDLYLYHSNSHALDSHLGGLQVQPATAGKSNVYKLGSEQQAGLQDFMNSGPGYSIAFTPSSTLNAHVTHLSK